MKHVDLRSQRKGSGQHARLLRRQRATSLHSCSTKKGTWWDWDEAKTALEYLFLTGQVMASGRGSDFARIYDLPERVLPARIVKRATPTEHEARSELLARAAIAQGIATADDL
ncbi:MAG: hypothetical protein EBY95_07215, partial [Actinobacteria bacterium]|nr:hypothetical protein [Actinomycetota bacterium]